MIQRFLTLFFLAYFATSSAFAAQTVEVLTDTNIYQNRGGKMAAVGQARAGQTFALGRGGPRGQWVPVSGNGMSGWVPANKVQVGESSGGGGGDTYGSSRSSGGGGYGYSGGKKDNYAEFNFTTNAYSFGIGGGYFFGFGNSRNAQRLEVGAQGMVFPFSSTLLSNYSILLIHVGGVGRYRFPIAPKIELYPEIGLFMQYLSTSYGTYSTSATGMFLHVGGGGSYAFNDKWSGHMNLSFGSGLGWILGVEYHL